MAVIMARVIERVIDRVRAMGVCMYTGISAAMLYTQIGAYTREQDVFARC